MSRLVSDQAVAAFLFPKDRPLSLLIVIPSFFLSREEVLESWSQISDVLVHPVVDVQFDLRKTETAKPTATVQIDKPAASTRQRTG